MKFSFVKAVFLGSVLVLSGCFFPQNERQANQVPYLDQLASVQTVIDSFQENTGVLPIKTFNEQTPTYERYVIDFRQLVPGYMQEPPGTAFENGGAYQYVLVNVEEDPTVKLIDLQSMNTIRELTSKINDYKSKHTYAPYTNILSDGLFELDFEKLSYEQPPYVISPYTGNTLPLLYSSTGEIIIDYASDINQVLEDHDVDQETDLRPLLYEDSPFVPFRSVPYTLNEDSEPELDPLFVAPSEE